MDLRPGGDELTRSGGMLGNPSRNPDPTAPMSVDSSTSDRPPFPFENQRMTAARRALVLAFGLSSCEPTLSVGEWKCAPNGAPDAAPTITAPIGVPWSTGFENRFCDYTELAGFCYDVGPATYATVTSPVHTGRHAAAFTVHADDPNGLQARCVRQGILPKAAYYGAWYFVPSVPETSGVWNLVHFQGGDPSAQHGLWDISLVDTADGHLQTVVFDFLNGVGRNPVAPAPIPIASWFHLELYLSRAADATGEVALYQDGRLLFQVTNIITDDTDWGQWYVGNYADGRSPAESTLYVDDITISAVR
jgi:hypothetical protein